MKIKVSPEAISFSNMKKLQLFEDELCSEIKSYLNDSYPSIKVNIDVCVVEWNDYPVRVKHNANPSIERSVELAEKIMSYLSTRDDVELILDSRFTLLIDIIMSKKMSETNNTNNKEKENSVEFYPSKPRYNFNQIILPEDIKTEIFDALKVIQCKDLVYSQWGFEEVDSVPRSILNFYGAPGTGKTMCAHAVASQLGKSLLALNYSEIESKFVGEAPKNLQHAFDVAKESDSVLFFDEADSFLGKRIENVTQGADQALNSLRSQMLILLEEFEGVVIFATNLVTNFDPAFESRILKHIRFELPNQEARAAIIKKMIPSKLPLLSPLTDEQYNEASSLIDGFSGREIKGAILDMILSKADPEKTDVTFSVTDLYDVLKKKQQEKLELKAEDERRLKEKIEKKIKEKAAEAEALNSVQQLEESTKE